MASTALQEITVLLRAWNEGGGSGAGKAAALGNEAYLRLVEAQQVNWQNRAHFFGV